MGVMPWSWGGHAFSDDDVAWCNERRWTPCLGESLHDAINLQIALECEVACDPEFQKLVHKSNAHLLFDPTDYGEAANSKDKGDIGETVEHDATKRATSGVNDDTIVKKQRV